MRKIIFLILILYSVQAFGKKMPFEEIIETDSSTIEIIRNSLYRIYEETYKYSDSIWYNVTYIDDTTKLHTEGWRTKSDEHLGIWKEYNRQGELMYSWDHGTGICNVNKSLFPFHDLLEQMKLKADSLIISAYSKEFFNNHVRFENDGSCYDKDEYLGCWTEPLKRRPTEFLFRYSVKLATSDWYHDMIEISLDSLGNFIQNSPDSRERYGFEEVIGDKKTFNIDIHKAKEIAKSHGLAESDTSEISEFLTWDIVDEIPINKGYFRYYITELNSKTEYKKGTERQGIIYRFNVYSFNPWTGEFLEKKKMKTTSEWGPRSGYSSGLMPDDE